MIPASDTDIASFISGKSWSANCCRWALNPVRVSMMRFTSASAMLPLDRDKLIVCEASEHTRHAQTAM